MGRSIKLVCYYFAYQLLFIYLAGKVAIDWTTTGSLDLHATESNITTAAAGMVLAGVVMMWHLIHFNYVKFDKTSWTEVPARTVALSIPFIVGASFTFNIASEFVELPNLLEDTFMGMSRNVFGILSIAVMAPLVEELLFRGAIEGHLLRTGKSPRMAIFLSALIFGIIHFNPVQIFFAFCLGLVFGWLYYRTGSVIPGIVGHFLNNSVATLLMATSTREEMNLKTIDLIGPVPTYLLWGTAILVFAGMFFYLNRHLPHPAQATESMNPEA